MSDCLSLYLGPSNCCLTLASLFNLFVLQFYNQSHEDKKKNILAVKIVLRVIVLRVKIRKYRY